MADTPTAGPLTSSSGTTCHTYFGSGADLEDQYYSTGGLLIIGQRATPIERIRPSKNYVFGHKTR